MLFDMRVGAPRWSHLTPTARQGACLSAKRTPAPLRCAFLMWTFVRFPPPPPSHHTSKEMGRVCSPAWGSAQLQVSWLHARLRVSLCQSVWEVQQPSLRPVTHSLEQDVFMCKNECTISKKVCSASLSNTARRLPLRHPAQVLRSVSVEKLEWSFLEWKLSVDSPLWVEHVVGSSSSMLRSQILHWSCSKWLAVNLFSHLKLLQPSGWTPSPRACKVRSPPSPSDFFV